MDVIGAGGPLGSRQILTAQLESTRVGGGQSAGNRSFARTLQETGAAETATSVNDRNTALSSQRANRVVSAGDIQNPDRTLPRGSLVNIVV